MLNGTHQRLPQLKNTVTVKYIPLSHREEFPQIKNKVSSCVASEISHLTPTLALKFLIPKHHGEDQQWQACSLATLVSNILQELITRD